MSPPDYLPDGVPSGPPTGNPLLAGPILPALLRLSLPSALAMGATVGVAVAETAYVGLLGTASLAGLAVVFPIAVLQHSLSNGAMGGGISSAVSRALGAGDQARAEALALHGLIIAVVWGGIITALVLAFGEDLYSLLGARDAALAEASRYSRSLFAGAILIWVTNTLVSVVRGSGNMRMPSATLMSMAAAQIVLGAGLAFGIGPVPPMGIAGIATGQLIAFGSGALYLFHYTTSTRARVRLRLAGQPLRWLLFRDILKVGSLSCIAPLQTNLTVIVLTSAIATFGTSALAGYGIGARLELLLVNVTFGVGVACVPMVGISLGNGQIARARRVAWLGAALSAAMLGCIGVLVSIWPEAWARLFTADPGVIGHARAYLQWSGPAYGFFGIGLCLFFASQGAGKVLGTVAAGTLRLGMMASGCWLLAYAAAPAQAYFALVAAGMMAFGLAAALAVARTHWG